MVPSTVATPRREFQESRGAEAASPPSTTRVFHSDWVQHQTLLLPLSHPQRRRFQHARGTGCGRRAHRPCTTATTRSGTVLPRGWWGCFQGATDTQPWAQVLPAGRHGTRSARAQGSRVRLPMARARAATWTQRSAHQRQTQVLLFHFLGFFPKIFSMCWLNPQM